MQSCEGAFLGPNKEVNFGRVAIVSAVIWFIIFAVITVAVTTARTGGYGNDWQNFGNGLDSSGGLAGLLFYAILAILIPSQVFIINVLFTRQWRIQGKVAIGRGRLVGIIGGLITFIGVFFPWATVSGSTEGHAWAYHYTGSQSIALFIVPAFGFFGLESVAIPTKRSATLGLGCGILAILGTPSIIPILVSGPSVGQVTFEYGLYVTILGAIALIVGSVLARKETREVKTSAEAPLAEAPHQPDTYVAPQLPEEESGPK
jgi:hypothetical protein